MWNFLIAHQFKSGPENTIHFYQSSNFFSQDSIVLNLNSLEINRWIWGLIMSESASIKCLTLYQTNKINTY